jgi:hypothetical protein
LQTQLSCTQHFEHLKKTRKTAFRKKKSPSNHSILASFDNFSYRTTSLKIPQFRSRKARNGKTCPLTKGERTTNRVVEQAYYIYNTVTASCQVFFFDFLNFFHFWLNRLTLPVDFLRGLPCQLSANRENGSQAASSPLVPLTAEYRHEGKGTVCL